LRLVVALAFLTISVGMSGVAGADGGTPTFIKVHALPYVTAVDSRGNVWFTAETQALHHFYIGRLAAVSDAVTEWEVPSQVKDLALGPDSHIWYERDGGWIGYVHNSGARTEWAIPPINGNVVQPYHLVAGPDGTVWFTASENVAGFSVSLVGHITTAGQPAIVADFGGECGVPQIASGPDGNLWLPRPPGLCGRPETPQYVTRLTPQGKSTAFPVPTSACCGGLAGITSGPDGALWMIEDQAGVVRMSTDGSANYYPACEAWNHITTGSDGALYFESFLGNYLGRITPSADVSCMFLGKTPTNPTGDKAGNVWFSATAVDVSTGKTSGYIGKLVVAPPA
jgi:virginiamycin B lyase